MNVLHAAGDRIEFDTVVFDLFHTLVDPQAHAPPGHRRLSAVADVLDLPVMEIELWWEQVVGELVSSPVSPIDALVELARVRRIVLTPTAVAELDRAMGAAADASLSSPIEGVADTLSALSAAGIPLGILSNALVRDVRAFPQSPVAGLVDDACISCFTGLVKPDPAAYRQALERLGQSPDRALFVGDGGSDEFVGARASGFAGVVAVTGAVESGGWRAPDEQERIVAHADIALDGVGDLLTVAELEL